jgi:hypothetical protein
MKILRSSIASLAVMTGLVAGMTSMPAADNARAQGIFCIDIYKPVCALTTFGYRQTFSNACWAGNAHARVLHPGVCEGPICNKMIKPVCAVDPKTHRARSYGNLCESEVANATWLHNGPCLPVKKKSQ